MTRRCQCHVNIDLLAIIEKQVARGMRVEYQKQFDISLKRFRALSPKELGRNSSKCNLSRVIIILWLADLSCFLKKTKNVLSKQITHPKHQKKMAAATADRPSLLA